MTKDKYYDLIIVGGGILGASVFYEYQKKYPKKTILLLEKENTFAVHQTGRNSGVIHSGIYYKPNSLKAKNCREGLKLLYEFCRKYNVPYDNCGKLIVAKNKEEVKYLYKLKERGERNGIKNLEILNTFEAKKYEPYLECEKALKVLDTGIVDYTLVAKELIKQSKLINSNSNYLYNNKVTNFSKENNLIYLKTENLEFMANKIVFCTGLQSDRFAKADHINLKIRVVPFRGDYYVLKNRAFHKVKNLIYPVANPDLPFLGVHLTRMMNDTIECGPNAVFSFKREGYNKLSFSALDTVNALSFSGTWKLFTKFWKIGLAEYYRAFSKKRFLKSIQELVPSLEMKDLGTWRAGVRAQVVNEAGELVDDFLIEKGLCGLHVINAPSPAATSCLSIAKTIISRIEDQ